jgi:hypothetical protein
MCEGEPAERFTFTASYFIHNVTLRHKENVTESVLRKGNCIEHQEKEAGSVCSCIEHVFI